MSLPTPDEILLGLLAAAPRHGYQLLETFRDPAQLGMVWDLSTSQIYAVLKRLEGQNFILGQQVDVQNAPPRTEYRITPAGREHLHRWLNEPNPSASIRRVRVEFLSRLYIAHLLGIPAESLIARQKAACERERSTLVTQRESAGAAVGLLALELVIEQLNAVLKWLERCEIIFDKYG